MRSLNFFKNISLNIFSSIIFTATLQLLVYPFLSYLLPETKFGTVLTVIGISNAAAAIFGGSLNNVRLIKNYEYTEDNEDGDFSFLLIVSLILAFVFSFIGFFFFQNQLSYQEIILLCIVTLLTTIRAYGTVYYRIDLNYAHILKHMIITGLGYIVGLFFSNLLNNWILTFLIGEIFSFIYLIVTTSILREKIKFTKKFKSTAHDSIQLTLSNISGNLLLYLDRLLINPILGSSQVAVYYAASIVGKMVGVIFQPLTGVFLSYLSKSDKKSGWGHFKITFFLSLVSGVVLYFVTIIVSPVLMKILYQDLYNEAINIYKLANLGAIIQVCGNLLQPILFKYCKLGWQNVIQMVYTLVYLTLGIYLMNQYGLYGFVYAVMVSNLIKYILMVGIAYINLKPKNF